MTGFLDETTGYRNQPHGFPQLTNNGVVAVAQGGTNGLITKILNYSATFDPASIAAGAFLATDFTVAGAAIGDMVLIGAGVDVVDLIVSATITAADTLTLTLYNPTASAIDLASSTWNAKVVG